MWIAFPSNYDSSKVLQPGNGSFDNPSPPVTPKLSTILRGLLSAIYLVRTDHLNTPLHQTLSQWIRVVSPIQNQAFRFLARTTSAASWNRYGLQRFFQKLYLRRRRRGDVHSERYTRAVRHHHKFCTLSTFGFSHTITPFFAGENVPSVKTSSQPRCCCSFNSANNARQAFNQIPCSSQSRKRRQQVLGEGYPSGKSFHRAPLRNTQSMPSKTGRLGNGLGPPRGEPVGLGNNGSMIFHCSSVSSVLSLAIANSFRLTWPVVKHKCMCKTSLC